MLSSQEQRDALSEAGVKPVRREYVEIRAEEPFDVDGYAYAIVDLHLDQTRVHFEVLGNTDTEPYNPETWLPVGAVKLETGSAMGTKIMSGGKYLVDLRGATQLRVALDYHAFGTLDGYLTLTNVRPLVPAQKAVGRYRPAMGEGYGQVPTTDESRPNMTWGSMDVSDGTLYGVEGGSVYKTEDYQETVEQLHDASSAAFTVRGAQHLPNGKVLAILEDGFALSDSAQSNFERVATFAFNDQQYAARAMSVCGNQIVYIPYENPKAEGTESAYYSDQFGEEGSWGQYDFENTNANFHFHHSAIDPFSGRVWMVGGDAREREMFFTDDFFGTVESAKDVLSGIGQMHQMLQTHFLPDCTLFLTDGPACDGVFRLQRDEGDSGRTDVHAFRKIECALDLRHDDETGSQIIVTGNEECSKTGVSYVVDPKTPRSLWASRTGWDYRMVCPSLVASGGNPQRVMGPDANGNLVVTTNSNGQSGLFLLPAAEWETV